MMMCYHFVQFRTPVMFIIIPFNALPINAQVASSLPRIVHLDDLFSLQLHVESVWLCIFINVKRMRNISALIRAHYVSTVSLETHILYDLDYT